MPGMAALIAMLATPFDAIASALSIIFAATPCR